jgi:hypothetical protein
MLYYSILKKYYYLIIHTFQSNFFQLNFLF